MVELTANLDRRDSALHERLVLEWLNDSSTIAGALDPDPEAQSRGRSPAHTAFFELAGNHENVGYNDLDGERFAEWMNGFAGKPYVGEAAVEEVADRLAERNPVRALEWIESFTQASPQLGGRATSEAMRTFAERDARGAAGWLDTNRDSSHYTEALVGFFEGQRNKVDDATIDKWLATVGDDSQRANLAKQIAATRKPDDSETEDQPKGAER
jgi:hypothetical protein